MIITSLRSSLVNARLVPTRMLRRAYTATSNANKDNLRDESIEVIKSSIEHIKECIKKKDYSGLQYPLFKKTLSPEFIHSYSTAINNNLDKLKEEISATITLTSTEKKRLNPKVSIVPNAHTASMLIPYLISNKDNLKSLPIKISPQTKERSSLQRTVDDLTERLIYAKIKPYNLQHTFNHAANNQNFNTNLTFNIMDIDNPYEWYPEARKLKRKFIMHVGPTNSGKTYNALKRLEQSSKGYFAGPLRLLAREVYDKFQSKGMPCNLVTGEEVIVDVDEFGNKAGLTSGTIEMLSLSEEYDVIVVDEIQMIGDEFRGFAWTNAILGARCKEIHLCGELAAVPLVKKLVSMTNDDIEIIEYERLGSLVVDEEPASLDDLHKGDCIVCFSKNNILNLKSQIEQETNFKCAVIYGALPPETRAQEAQRFNDGEYDIVVASDAIGMGLNLKINRVIFTTTQKYNGITNISLTSSNIKQIGGRAGRFGVGNSIGHISALDVEELENVREGINQPIQYLKQAYLYPPESLWVKYYSMFSRGTELITIYRKFENDLAQLYADTSKTKRDFKIVSLEDMKLMTQFFQAEKLSKGFNILDQLRFVFCPSPLTKSDRQPLHLITTTLFKQFCVNVLERGKKSLFDYQSLPLYLTSTSNMNLQGVSAKTRGKLSKLIEAEPVPAEMKERLLKRSAHHSDLPIKTRKVFVRDINPVEERLMRLEKFHKLIGTYLWLSYRFPQNFTDIESTTKLKNLVEFKISEMLSNLRASPVSTKRYKTYNRYATR
ncbi:hypothetical protein CANARDRAFT_27285 [[Candida] arabinofermentans NRRL YB-2248]|uniref:ATP-dependent RNA helicase SUV3, mitochondrial n=1 Tax=[Candida] arabinofermentans NRRL YB-2248 TaxID=983967 RepID=A0A1E4T5B8_9ASCO|nr:hypothetical protein CANARDRAFT_27285 [[Candida] arabinofermentans NRRL YB-2248]